MSDAFTTISAENEVCNIPVNLSANSVVISQLLHTIRHFALCTHLYGNANIESDPWIKDSHLGDIYSLQIGQFYDLSIDISRCDGSDMRVEVSVVVIQNEVPVLFHQDDEKSTRCR